MYCLPNRFNTRANKRSSLIYLYRKKVEPISFAYPGLPSLLWSYEGHTRLGRLRPTRAPSLQNMLQILQQFCLYENLLIIFYSHSATCIQRLDGESINVGVMHIRTGKGSVSLKLRYSGQAIYLIKVSALDLTQEQQPARRVKWLV